MGILQPGHLILILLLALIIVGPGKLANLGGALGKSVREFRQSIQPGDEETAKEEAKGEVKKTES